MKEAVGTVILVAMMLVLLSFGLFGVIVYRTWEPRYTEMLVNAAILFGGALILVMSIIISTIVGIGVYRRIAIYDVNEAKAHAHMMTGMARLIQASPTVQNGGGRPINLLMDSLDLDEMDGKNLPVSDDMWVQRG